jgi:amylosucrase
MYHGLRRLIEARVTTPHLHAAIPTRVLDVRNPHVFAFERAHPLGAFVALYNFSEAPQQYPSDVLLERGVYKPFDRITGQEISVSNGFVNLEPYARLWLVEANL